MLPRNEITIFDLDVLMVNCKSLGVLYGAGVSSESFGTFRINGRYSFNYDDMDFYSKCKNNF
jgi:hypothetical protein